MVGTFLVRDFFVVLEGVRGRKGGAIMGQALVGTPLILSPPLSIPYPSLTSRLSSEQDDQLFGLFRNSNSTPEPVGAQEAIDNQESPGRNLQLAIEHISTSIPPPSPDDEDGKISAAILLEITNLEDDDEAGEEEGNAGNNLRPKKPDAYLQIEHIMDDKNQRSSAASKEKSALFHFAIFLRSYFHARGLPNQTPQQLSFDGSSAGERQWDDIIGCFMNYLGKDAMCHGEAERGRISFASATGYASSIKGYYKNRKEIRTQQKTIPVFRSDQWRSLRGKLLKMFQEESRKSGKALSGSHAASTDDDRVAIAKACIWIGTPSMAEYFLQCNDSPCPIPTNRQLANLLSTFSLVIPSLVTPSTVPINQ